MKQIYDEWVLFNSIEREYYEGHDNNKYAFSASQIDRYIEFLLLLNVQHQTTSNSYNKIRIKMLKKLDSMKSNGDHVVDAELSDIFTNEREQSVMIQLEIESYYIYAKILLDKVAHFIRFYFGDQRDLSLKSHDKWVKSFDEYIAIKQLVCNRQMKEKIQELKEKISDYRDYQIEHNPNMRSIYSVGTDGENKITIAKNTIYPKDSDNFISSMDIEAITNLISEYITMIMELIVTNREKTKLELVR